MGCLQGFSSVLEWAFDLPAQQTSSLCFSAFQLPCFVPSTSSFYPFFSTTLLLKTCGVHVTRSFPPEALLTLQRTVIAANECFPPLQGAGPRRLRSRGPRSRRCAARPQPQRRGESLRRLSSEDLLTSVCAVPSGRSSAVKRAARGACCRCEAQPWPLAQRRRSTSRQRSTSCAS